MSKILLSNGIRLNYKEYGKNKVSKLLLIHGNGESMLFFNSLVSRLKNKYHIYLIDSRSHGSSSYSKLSYDLMAEDTYLFINSIGITDTKILGFSDGAIITLLLSINYNVTNEMILCGLNTKFDDLINKLYNEMVNEYKVSKNPYLKLMIDEPNISDEQLKLVNNKIKLIYGEDDVFKKKAMKNISKILNTKLNIIQGGNHYNYFIEDYLLEKLIFLID